MRRTGAIVLITTSFPIRGDGSEAAGSFVSDLAEELAKHVPVRVVAPGEGTCEEAWPGDVEIFRFAAPDKALSTLSPWRPAEIRAIGRVLAAGQVATERAVQAGPTAHMLALWALPSGHWARRVSRRAGIPYSVWTLGSDIWTLGKLPLVRAHLRRVLQDARLCYSDGFKLADETRAICDRPVEFLPSTRRIERARMVDLKKAAPYRLLFLGRWHPNKGIDLLIAALNLLSDEDWRHIEVVEICGGGPMESTVRRGVAGLLAAGRRIALRGYVQKPVAENALLCADYLLIPSRIESIPVVFSDAIKLGCPVIASPVGDLPRLVNATPRCGLVAESVDAHAYATAISSALRQPPASFARGLAAMARTFDLTGLARDIASRHGAECHG
ncbi:MAG: glycosyltransferase [Sinimarinibacterium flocculans]|uniref:glycosyltransferase n=1 Tax=Sinimarinibacterium flocculans TaxID=985250 RepID=UPI003C4485B1